MTVTRSQHGFTLIELMVSVAIIGILASVALPSFQRLQLRSRQAERATILHQILVAIDDYYNREGHFPIYDPANPTWSQLNLQGNPSWMPTATRQPWRRVSFGPWDNWKDIAFSVDGAVFYIYQGSGQAWMGGRFLFLEADGDLDANGRWDQLQRMWWYTGNTVQRWAGSPADSNASWEWCFPSAAGQCPGTDF